MFFFFFFWGGGGGKTDGVYQERYVLLYLRVALKLPGISITIGLDWIEPYNHGLIIDGTSGGRAIDIHHHESVLGTSNAS